MTEWDVHNHVDQECSVVFGSSGLIGIYFGAAIIELYKSETASLIDALGEALRAAGGASQCGRDN